MKYGFGVDLGGTTVKIAYFEETGEMRSKWEIPTNRENSGSQILPDIAASIGDFCKSWNIPREELLGIGIGVPGAVSKGVVNCCVNLGWGVVAIEEELSKLTGLPVKASNDANVAALGEYWKGGGLGCDNVVFVTLGTGVGGGIIVDGKLMNGAHGSGGELGHMVLDPKETAVCGCGKRGCLEQYSSATGVVSNYLAECKKAGVEPIELTGPSDSKDVFQACREGDKLALAAADTMADYLGRALALIANVVDPEMFLIGGGASASADVYLDKVREHFKQYALSASRETPIKVASLGNDAGIIGAAYVALRAAGK